MSFLRLLILPVIFVFASCATVPPAPAAEVREQGFVIAANPLAARAGMEVLERGGSAVDAAIAVQAMLSLVEPQSSGIGGGAFITYYDAASRKISIYDGRETAPAQATPEMFLDPVGKPLPFGQAVLSGRATGVPGVVANLALAHREHGKLQWRSLFGSAERTADEGFIVSPRLGRLLAGNYPENSTPDVVAYFRNADGSRMKAGDRLRNPAYAAFLRRLEYEHDGAGQLIAQARQHLCRCHQHCCVGVMPTGVHDVHSLP